MDRSFLKAKAKQTVLNNKIIMVYFFAILACSVVGSFFSAIPLLGFFITLAISICCSSFIYGLSVYYAMDEGQNSSMYFSTIMENIMKFIKIYLWYFVKMLPAIIVMIIIMVPVMGILVATGFSVGLGNDVGFGGIVVLICLLVIFVGSIFSSVFIYYITFKYSLSLFMAFDEDFYNISAKECVQLCGKMMDGHKMELFIFQLSFILWIIGGALSFGLLYIYVLPYYQVALANYYLELKNELM